jgi:hypothetical protein
MRASAAAFKAGIFHASRRFRSSQLSTLNSQLSTTNSPSYSSASTRKLTFLIFAAAQTFITSITRW